MKKTIITSIFISLITTVNLNANDHNITTENNQSKSINKTTLVINLDKEQEQKRGGKVEDIIRGMLTIGDNNDEVTFVGKLLANASNIIIIIQDSTGKIKQTIKNSLTIKTDWLENMDMVIIKKDNKTIVKKEVKKRE